MQRKAEATTPNARNCSPLSTMAMDSAHSCPAKAGPSALMPAASMLPKPLTGPISSIGDVTFTRIMLQGINRLSSYERLLLYSLKGM